MIDYKIFPRKGAQVWDFEIFTYGLDTGYFVFATACAVYASNLLPYCICIVR